MKRNYELNELNVPLNEQFCNYVADYYEGIKTATFVLIRSFSCQIPRYDLL